MQRFTGAGEAARTQQSFACMRDPSASIKQICMERFRSRQSSRARARCRSPVRGGARFVPERVQSFRRRAVGGGRAGQMRACVNALRGSNRTLRGSDTGGQMRQPDAVRGRATNAFRPARRRHRATRLLRHDDRMRRAIRLAQRDHRLRAMRDGLGELRAGRRWTANLRGLRRAIGAGFQGPAGGC